MRTCRPGGRFSAACAGSQKTSFKVIGEITSMTAACSRGDVC